MIRTSLLLALLAVVGCGHGPAGHAPNEKVVEPLAAATLTVVPVPWPVYVRVQGNLEADEEATLSSRVAGLVEKVNADRGQAVKAGDVLVELRAVDFDLKVKHADAAVKQTRSRLGLREEAPDTELDPLRSPPVREAQANLNDAIARFERTRGLAGSAAASAEELQTLKAAVEVAQARYNGAMNQVRETIATLNLNKVALSQAQQDLRDAKTVAPFDGTIAERMTAKGANVLTGTPLFVLVKTDRLRFTAGVPERRTLQVQLNQKVRVHVEGVKEPLEGTVTRLSPALAMTSRSLVVEVDVPNPGSKIPANFFAEADILVEPEARSLAIPLSALSEFAGVEKVWVVRDGQAVEQRVRTGRRDFQRVEVTEGLKAGDVVLADARLGRPGPVKLAR